MSESGERQMGSWMTGALVVGTMIGSGIFILPMSLAPLGANAVIAWIVSSAGALCIAFALARLSRLGGCGIQANVEGQLGATAGFLVAWAFWVANWVSQAAIALAGASALSWINPGLGGQVVVPAAIASVIFFTAVNALGARAAGRAQLLTVAIKLLPLIAVIALLGLRSAGGAPFEPLANLPVNVGNIASAVALTFFALLGFESATTPVGKVKEAERTIPRAIMAGTLFVALIYLLASTGVQLLLPAGVAASSAAPFADVIALQWGDAAASLAALAIAVAAFGALNGIIFSTGELGYSMALRGDLPAVLARTWRGTPVVSQLLGSSLCILLILANASRTTASLFSFLILLTTAATLLIYVGGAAAAWRLCLTAPPRAVLLLAFLFIGFAFWGSGIEADFWCLALLGAGLVIRTLFRTVQEGRLAAASTVA